MIQTGPKTRLHVICAHEPDLDPRISWTAQTAARNGYDVQTIGWIAGRVAESSETDDNTLRLAQDSPAKSGFWLMAQLARMAGLPALWAFAVMGAPFLGLWLVGTIVLLPWRMLDYVAERLGQHERTTRPVERMATRIRAWLFWRVDALFSGGVVRLINGLNAYRWYFLTHAGAFARRYAHWLEAHPENVPDVIHANDPDALMAAVLIKRLHNCRVIYDAHEYGPDAYILHTTPRSVFFTYERILMAHVDGAVTVSPPIANKFNEQYEGRPHFAVVPNASPLVENLSNNVHFALDELSRGRIRVLYQGGFAAHRGLEEVIAAWNDVDDSKAALFLRGPDNEFRKVLVRAAQKAGRLNKSVFFLPSVSEDQLTVAALEADIGVVPYLSHIENHQGACPNKVGQYMQAGLAIVSANLPFVASLLERGECGTIYDDGDDQALSATLNALIQHPEKVAQMGENGRSFARTHYNFEAYFLVLDNLYRSGETGNQQELMASIARG